MLTSAIINAFSFVILCFYLYGRSLRKKNVHKHIKTMYFAIGADVALVLFLVFARSALTKVHLGMSAYLVVHICFAISTVVLYGFAIYVGLQLKKGNRAYLAKMRLIDKILTPTRILTLVTSVSLMFL